MVSPTLITKSGCRESRSCQTRSETPGCASPVRSPRMQKRKLFAGWFAAQAAKARTVAPIVIHQWLDRFMGRFYQAHVARDRSCRMVLIIGMLRALPATLAAVTVLFICGCKRATPDNVAATVNGDRKSTRLNSSHLGISY